MIINREGFFCKLGIEFKGTQLGIGMENFHQLKSQLAGKGSGLGYAVTPQDTPVRRASHQVTIIEGCQRVAFRHASCRAPLAVRRDEDVICLVENGFKSLQFAVIIRPVHLKIQVARVNSAVFTVRAEAIYRVRNGIVPTAFMGRCKRMQYQLSVAFLR